MRSMPLCSRPSMPFAFGPADRVASRSVSVRVSAPRERGMRSGQPRACLASALRTRGDTERQTATWRTRNRTRSERLGSAPLYRILLWTVSLPGRRSGPRACAAPPRLQCGHRGPVRDSDGPVDGPGSRRDLVRPIASGGPPFAAALPTKGPAPGGQIRADELSEDLL